MGNHEQGNCMGVRGWRLPDMSEASKEFRVLGGIISTYRCRGNEVDAGSAEGEALVGCGKVVECWV